ncbi:MAG: SUMF1/EgtB/PvdO family nonheme iron enzyme [Flavobacteriales bacterium]|nr:SUMF1/EgtB/PvdO family nonheme iron enzyme [Flavobacteriales bacterium]
MKTINKIFLLGVVAIFSACAGGNGELIGVQGREIWFEPVPYGMLYIPAGSFTMGPSDQDVPFANQSQSKTVTLPAFWIDHTEITNNEYRQFVYWVRDSIAHYLLGEVDEEAHLIMVDRYGDDWDPPSINWRTRIEWYGDEERETLESMYLPEHERFNRRKEFDTRKYLFEYTMIDLRDAARKGTANADDGGAPLRKRGMTDRSIFIKRDVIPIYPDTLCWVHDFTYAYNEPLTNMYFWHPAYDEYPVVGVSWKQARAFCIWRTNLLNSFLNKTGQTFVQNFRLPTETEWEYAARGTFNTSPYPWGGPYIRNSRGCFLGNFKPLRGDYYADGGIYTVKVGSYNPNDYGLYDMAGNAAEWTSNAFDESAYNFSHDLSPDYVYEADDADPEVLKRKVIRGGSWKDLGMYMQTSTRTYEYQDTAKSYIGFRCVRTYLGRDVHDVL